MIDRISGRIALLLIVVAALLVLLIGWFVLISPERSKAAKLGTQISTTDSQLASVQAFLDGPTKKQDAKELPVLKRALPDTPQMSELLRELSSLSARVGVAVTSISPGTLAPSGGAEAQPLNLNVTGRYFALDNFLQILRRRAYLKGDTPHSTGRLYSVDGIQFSGGATASGTSVVQATVTLNAFVYGGASAATATTTAATTTTTG